LTCECHKNYTCMFIYNSNDNDRHEAEFVATKIPTIITIYNSLMDMHYVFVDPVTYEVACHRAIRGGRHKFLDKHMLFNIIIPLSGLPLDTYIYIVTQLQSYLIIVPDADDQTLQDFIKTVKVTIQQ